MKKSEKDKQNTPLDDDILEGKKDVLRAKDIIPISPSTTRKNSSVLPQAVSQQTQDKTKIEKKETEIPQFDLAEKIMPQQRKISSVKRKAPAKDNNQEEKVQLRSQPYIFNQSILTNHEENHLIAQIVARDIKRLLQEK
jgi:hypothetical protein